MATSGRSSSGSGSVSGSVSGSGSGSGSVAGSRSAGWGAPDEVVTLVDESRRTPAHGTFAEEPARVLETHLWLPRGAGAPSPLVVFAHGWVGHPRKFTRLFSAWREAGYAVAAPAFRARRTS